MESTSVAFPENFTSKYIQRPKSGASGLRTTPFELSSRGRKA